MREFPISRDFVVHTNFKSAIFYANYSIFLHFQCTIIVGTIIVVFWLLFFFQFDICIKYKTNKLKAKIYVFIFAIYLLNENTRYIQNIVEASNCIENNRKFFFRIIRRMICNRHPETYKVMLKVLVVLYKYKQHVDTYLECIRC